MHLYITIIVSWPVAAGRYADRFVELLSVDKSRPYLAVQHR